MINVKTKRRLKKNRADKIVPVVTVGSRHRWKARGKLAPYGKGTLQLKRRTRKAAKKARAITRSNRK